MVFHRRCGRRVSLTNENRTATRSTFDFNFGLVLSAEPLQDDVLFEVRIDAKESESWSGNIKIGVTTENPETAELPSCATKMRHGTWVMAGISVIKDGVIQIEFYGTDLDTLSEGDRVGVMRTSNSELIFYVNGESQGVAATSVPATLYAVVDLYGKCLQVSACPSDSLEYPMDSTQITQNIDIPMSVDVSIIGSQAGGDYIDCNDRLRFHNRCGSLVKLSTNSRTAERRRPLDEFNNGVVMTHRPLKDNELFEIRIDKLVDKWSGSIEVGVTTHNPATLHFPATMTNMRSGTIMMSGCGILTNGKGTRRQYGEFNLDELREGDRVGMMRKANGNLHYYINGQDQGVAATRVAQTLWGVIDLYGMTIKVTIVDRDEREQQNLVTRRNNMLCAQNTTTTSTVISHEPASLSPQLDTVQNNDRLTFHPICGLHASVTHSGRTALRPNASDDFNNGVVLTRRPLRPNELFQVRLERVVTKWAGSVEMGVTTHSATDLDFPFTMTNVRSGTWMMTGNGIMHNGTTIKEKYGQNLDRLQVGDRVGVVRKDDGTLHFWVNGVDQGPAATNVPERVYGVIDLYGQAAQASIVDTSECGSPDTGNSTISNTTLYSEPPLRFHSVHGKNARISNGGLTASRPKALAEFNDAVVFSNRPLRQRELFEVVIEAMVFHWSGNIEIGVTGVRPDEIQLEANATDLQYETIILCGAIVFHNRQTICNNIPFDLDTLTNGARVGVMRNGDYIHFFIDGVDQGPACECRFQNVYAVVDLYGQCAQVSLTLAQPDLRAPYATSENSQSFQATSVIQPTLETKHRWALALGNNTLSLNFTVAERWSRSALSSLFVFSEHPLAVGSPFEVKITSYDPMFSGCLNIGVTDLNFSDENVLKNIPTSMKRIPANVWYVSGNEVRFNSTVLHRSVASLEWLRVGDRITLELTPARTLRVLLNSDDMNINFHNVSNDVYVVAELKGTTMAIQVTSSQGPSSPLRPCSLRLQDSLEFAADPLKQQDSMLESIDSESLLFEFSEFHGKNIVLSEDKRSATRTQSFNHALVYITKPLCKGHSISIKIDQIDTRWKGTIGVGALGMCPQSNNAALPPSIIMCKRPCWIATNDYININGNRVPSKYGEALDNIQQATVITMSLSHTGSLVVMVGHNYLEELSSGLPNHVYPVFDVYGKCEKITIINGDVRNGTPILEEVSLSIDQAVESDTNAPQCEKADLEVHEKETDLPPNVVTTVVAQAQEPSTSSAGMSRSVMESMSENLLTNLSIKSRAIGIRNSENDASTPCCLRESLQLQHNTNLNIQRSQSTQRLKTSLPENDTNRGEEHHEPPCEDVVAPDSLTDLVSMTQALDIATSESPNQQDIAYELEHEEEGATAVIIGVTQSNSDISNEAVEPDHSNIECNDDAENRRPTDDLTLLALTTPTPLANNHCNYPSNNESIVHSIPSHPRSEIIDCDYVKLVCGFKKSLLLPDAFFATFPPSCFCASCAPACNTEIDAHGWVRFELNQHAVNPASTTINSNTSPDWKKLYHVTRIYKIRAILDHGQPLPIEAPRESCSAINQKDEPGMHLILNSSLNGISTTNTNSTHRYVSGLNAYTIGTAFEVYVRPQALSLLPDSRSAEGSGGDGGVEEAEVVARTTTGDEEEGATALVDKGVIWTTKEAGACVLTALLLRLEFLEELPHAPVLF